MNTEYFEDGTQIHNGSVISARKSNFCVVFVRPDETKFKAYLEQFPTEQWRVDDEYSDLCMAITQGVPDQSRHRRWCSRSDLGDLGDGYCVLCPINDVEALLKALASVPWSAVRQMTIDEYLAAAKTNDTDNGLFLTDPERLSDFYYAEVSR
jgi:hypothetical protein